MYARVSRKFPRTPSIHDWCSFSVIVWNGCKLIAWRWSIAIAVKYKSATELHSITVEKTSHISVIPSLPDGHVSTLRRLFFFILRYLLTPRVLSIFTAAKRTISFLHSKSYDRCCRSRLSLSFLVLFQMHRLWTIKYLITISNQIKPTLKNRWT